MTGLYPIIRRKRVPLAVAAALPPGPEPGAAVPARAAAAPAPATAPAALTPAGGKERRAKCQD